MSLPKGCGDVKAQKAPEKSNFTVIKLMLRVAGIKAPMRIRHGFEHELKPGIGFAKETANQNYPDAGQ
jgi:hypothetical protein